MSESKALADVAQFASGKFLPPAQRVADGSVPVYGANGLIGRTLEPSQDAPVITVGRVGACGEVHRTQGPAWVSDNALVVQPKPGVTLDYLYYALQAVDYSSIKTGTTQPLITQTALKALRILVPDDSARQDEVVATLTAADEAARCAQSRFAALTDLERGLADEVFGPAAEQWPRAKLEDVAAVDRGVSWAKEQESVRPAADRTPVVRIGNVQRDAIDMTDRLYLTGVSERDRERKALTGRHILMVGSNGNVERIGNAFRASAAQEGHVFASFLIGVRCADEDAALYTTTWLRAPHVQHRLRDSTSGSTGLKNLGLKTLRAMELPLAPDPVRKAVIEVAAEIEETRTRLATASATARSLKHSLAAEIFEREAV